MAWTEALLSLQAIDLELSTVHKRLEEVNVALQDAVALQQARQQAQEAAAEAEKAQKAQKDLEFNLTEVEAERSETETRLYSGEVRNSRQLEDLQAKAQSLKRQKTRIEDQLLEAMLVTETTRGEAEAAAATLQTVSDTWGDRHAALEKERAMIEEHIAALEAQSAEAVQEISPKILDAYRYLQHKMGGRAVARLEEDTCSVCGVEVNSQRQQSARAGQETYCDGCGRLLVV